MASPSSGPVLIVEDDVDARDVLQGLLEFHGFEVRVAVHGREAIEYLQGTPRPALILLDMAMPVMDGHRVLTFRKGVEGFQGIPVVIISAGMSAMSPRDRALYASNYNVAAFLMKPADPDQLLEIVERHVVRPAAGLAGSPA
jgi:CheY-like chemotaxis protein